MGIFFRDRGVYETGLIAIRDVSPLFCAGSSHGKSVQAAIRLRCVGETGYGCHTFYITDVFRNIVIIAEMRPLLCLNIVSCAHINMQFVIFT